MFIHEKINNVKAYEPITGWFIGKSSEFCFGVDKIKFDGNLFGIFRFGDRVLVLDEVNRAFYFEDNLLKEIGYDFRIGSLKYPIIEYYKKEQPRKYGLFDFSTQKILFETTNWIGRDIIGEFVFAQIQGVIVCRSIYSAQPLWQFDLGRLGEYTTQLNETKTYEVRKFLGVTENKLWVLLSNDELLMLDISTGEVINKINEIPAQKMNEYTCNRLGNCMVLDEKEGKIKGFVHFVYWELDAQTFEISTFNLKDTLAENQLFGIMNVLEFCQSDTHLFVPMKQIDENGSMWSFLIALNKETKQIDWKHQLPWTGNNTPQYANNKLYQLDNDNTLHIFEKENA